MSHQATVRGIGVDVGEEGESAPAVVLEARDELLPIVVNRAQARSIEVALRGVPVERPLCHDLLVEMVEEFEGRVEGIRIDDLMDGTFYAKVDAVAEHDDEGRRSVFDARPSDAIAIALRVGCTIAVTDDVMDEAGYETADLDREALDALEDVDG